MQLLLLTSELEWNPLFSFCNCDISVWHARHSLLRTCPPMLWHLVQLLIPSKLECAVDKSPGEICADNFAHINTEKSITVISLDVLIPPLRIFWLF